MELGDLDRLLPSASVENGRANEGKDQRQDQCCDLGDVEVEGVVCARRNRRLRHEMCTGDAVTQKERKSESEREG
jgi:hypothetical protein